ADWGHDRFVAPVPGGRPAVAEPDAVGPDRPRTGVVVAAGGRAAARVAHDRPGAVRRRLVDRAHGELRRCAPGGPAARPRRAGRLRGAHRRGGPGVRPRAGRRGTLGHLGVHGLVRARGGGPARGTTGDEPLGVAADARRVRGGPGTRTDRGRRQRHHRRRYHGGNRLRTGTRRGGRGRGGGTAGP